LFFVNIPNSNTDDDDDCLGSACFGRLL